MKARGKLKEPKVYQALHDQNVEHTDTLRVSPFSHPVKAVW
jgi:hypothetical protein